MRPASPIALLADNQSRPGKPATEPADPVALPAGATTVGGGRLCSLRLRGGGVRPLHCVINTTDDGAVVRRWAADTLLNGQPFTEAPLKPGDRLSVASIELKVVASPAAAPTPPAPAFTPTPVAAAIDSPTAPLPAVPAHLLKPLEAGANEPAGDEPDGEHDTKLNEKPLGPQSSAVVEALSGAAAGAAAESPAGEPSADRKRDPSVLLLRQRARRLLAAVRQERERAESLVAANTQLTETRAALEDAAAAAEHSAEIAKEDLSEAKSQLAASGVELESARRQLADAEERHRQAETSADQSFARRESAVEESAEQIASLTQEVVELRAEVEQLADRAEAATAEAELASASRVEADARATELEAERDALVAELSEQADVTESQQRRVAEVEAALARLEAAPAGPSASESEEPTDEPAPPAAPVDNPVADDEPPAAEFSWAPPLQGEAKPAAPPADSPAGPPSNAANLWDAAASKVEGPHVSNRPAPAEPEPTPPSAAQPATGLWDIESEDSQPAAADATENATGGAGPTDSADPVTPADQWLASFDSAATEPPPTASDLPSGESASPAPEAVTDAGGGLESSADPEEPVGYGTPIGAPTQILAGLPSPELDSPAPAEAMTDSTESDESAAAEPALAESHADDQQLEERLIEPADTPEPGAGELAVVTPAAEEELDGAPPLGKTLLGLATLADAAEKTETPPADEDGLVRADQPSAAAPESFIEKFAGGLPESEPAPEPARRPAPQPAPVADEDDSLDDYMAALMQRIRGEAATEPPQVGRIDLREAAAETEPESQTPTVSGFPTSPAMQPSPIPKSELLADLSEMRRTTPTEPAADLSALRELANSSARSNIGVADKKESKDKATANLAISGVAMVCAGYLGLTAPEVTSLQFIGGIVGFGWAGYWASQTLRHINAANKAGRADFTTRESALPIDKPAPEPEAVG